MNSYLRSTHESQPPSAVYATLSVEETASRLETSLTHGLLDTRDAQDRRVIHGFNELPQAEQDSIYVRFFKQFVESPLILLLLGSSVLSFLMKNYDDAISIAIAVLIVVTVGFVQEYRSEKSLEALNKLVPHFANLLRGAPVASEIANGGTPHSHVVTAGQLVPGDLVTFATGDRVPADIRITHAAELEIDESNLTGESVPVRKTTDAVAPQSTNPTLGEIPVSERSCIAFMGTLVRSGHGRGIVIATGQKTEFGSISAMLSEISTPRTPLQASMDKLGKDLSYASFGVIGLIVLLGLWQGRQWLDMFQIGVSLAVAAIPEGLPIIVTVTLALGVLRMVKRGGIVRKLPSVETLGCVSVVCSDKTGTLTMNHMTVTKLWAPDFPSPLEVSTLTSSPTDQAVRAIIRTGNMCNNARLSGSGTSASAAAIGINEDPSSNNSRFVGQPTDVALLDMMDAFQQNDVRDHFHRITETPFTSAKKWMGVVACDNSADGTLASVYIKGALEQIISKCDTYLTKDGREIVLDNARRKVAVAAAESMAEEGLRVLGFAKGITTVTAKNGTNDDKAYTGLTFVGAVGMYDPPRPGAEEAIRRLMRGSVKVMMITGDSEITAVAIARKLGMPLLPVGHSAHSMVKPVLRGEDIDAMTDSQLRQAITTTSIFARTSPEHKMRIIRALQANKEVVAMTGDGVNDAPALKMADIGIAMGIMGTDVAKEASDMILSNDSFSTILAAIEEGKGIFYNIQNFLTFQLSTSVAALSLVLLSTFFGLKNPLNPMQILWINILMDGPPAQSLGVEPVDPIVMTRPPRSRDAQILTRSVIRRILISAAIIVVGTMFIYVKEMAADGIVTARDTTMTFTCFVFFDMFNALACRSEGKSVLKGEVKILGNKMFNIAVALSLLGQMAVIYLPGLQGVFQTEALSAWDLFMLVCLTSSVFFADEARKFVNKGRDWHGGYSSHV
ncbi:calcium-transporting P [Wilcoxina mikolae CBS 423.85]|nr:calcium-transporting P [Wilcoxina mikolae CBS 423.85]